ncbi:hypothetical protein [Herbidospora mongoliensis]|uniref:hypothetical protein n=1 Tax=Herbidospora mongoliensis TaxID=688067 RepID=UPI00083559A0|nr:hypothetical protein [Herbidospora mongoliensis]
MVASWLARTMPPDTRIVAIFPDGPARYHATIFDDAYCAEHGLLDRPPADEVTRWTRMVIR